MPSQREESLISSLKPDEQRLLNAYILDYLVKQSYADTAQVFAKEVDLPSLVSEDASNEKQSRASKNTLSSALETADLQRQSEEAKANGLDQQLSEESPPSGASPDLGAIDVPIDIEGGFLAEWWTIFWDMFAARQGRPSSSNAANFIAHNQVRILVRCKLNSTDTFH